MDKFTKKKPGAEKAVAKKTVKPTVVDVAKSEVVAKSVSTGSASQTAYRVIVRPLLTEKSALLQTKNQYTFMVATWASKLNVKEAVKSLYGVTPTAVNLINVEGRRMRFGAAAGRRSDVKKAIVTLPAGQSITVHQGV